ncbi:general transcription and DNA repair factor IIH helicase subunit XPD-like [Schistocerca gregaria]|uniref:general transcription and DNA repair factor IIH helicase subunit XPD-like n=1 Tax=Schistocerca gregaria TaxID=7010 RepID=UPI00211EEBF0|nr:general transcription and DNA repair factor IIH helicase subunit XPD-like [Schistocerca gregaria]
MKFFLDGIWVFFPYDYIYPEQYEYMLHLKRALDQKGPCALEMPTGTGKTVSLLSLILSWILARREGMTEQQRIFENIPLNTNKDGIASYFKFIYCCRTLGEINKTIEELKNVWMNIERHMLEDSNEKIQNGGLTDSNEANISQQAEADSNEETSSAKDWRSDGPKSASYGNPQHEESKNTVLPVGNRVKLLALSLSSRVKMCLNPAVQSLQKRSEVDARCRDLTSPYIRDKALEQNTSKATQGRSHVTGVMYTEELEGLCPYYEGYEARGKDILLTGIYSFDDLSLLGKAQHVCPYFLCRRLLPLADIIVYSYQYILNPRISELVSQQLRSDSIVVFDEAHNIDDVCIEALSVRINRHTVQKAHANVRMLSQLGQQVETKDSEKFQKEYQELLKSLSQVANRSKARKDSKTTTPEETLVRPQDNGSTGAEQPIFDSSQDQIRKNPFFDFTISNPVCIPNQLLEIKSFVHVLDRIVGYFRSRLRQKQVVRETPRTFLAGIVSWIGTDENPEEPRLGIAEQDRDKNSGQIYQVPVVADRLIDYKTGAIFQHCSRRLQSLLNVLELKEIDRFTPISTICDLVSIAAAYLNEGFIVLMEPWDDRTPTISNPTLQLACLDASICMKVILQRFQRVILTSGTLSPITMLPRIIGMNPIVTVSLSMTLSRPSICPLIVSRGEDQTPLSSKFSLRMQPDVVRNFADLLLSLSRHVPDGIVCFFPSYQYLEVVVSMWNEMGMLHRLVQYKLLFVETENILETEMALTSYQQACDNGRGAVLLSVARGKVSEGVDFDHQYGRCVILFGIPYVYTESRILKAKLEFLRSNYQIRENDYLNFDAMRMAAQCIGRVFRGKSDYGIMIFADSRYTRVDKRDKLPQWVTQFLTSSQLNLSTEGATILSRQFLKLMAQPLSREAQLGTSLWDATHISQQPSSQIKNYQL